MPKKYTEKILQTAWLIQAADEGDNERELGLSFLGFYCGVDKFELIEILDMLPRCVKLVTCDSVTILPKITEPSHPLPRVCCGVVGGECCCDVTEM